MPLSVKLFFFCFLFLAILLGEGCNKSITEQTITDGSLYDVLSVVDVFKATDLQKHEAAVVTVPSQWITIEPGTFMMGSPEQEPCRHPADETQRQVTLTHKFEIWSTEVTNKQYVEAMGSMPFTSCGDYCPVGDVTWHMAAAYANRLSEIKNYPPCYSCTGSNIDLRCQIDAQYTGGSSTIYQCLGYRLPTEAEWEYAYRAGTTTALYKGTLDGSCTGNGGTNAETIAWYKYNAQGDMHLSGRKDPNNWSLYDMAGNNAEWVNDWCADSFTSATLTDPAGPTSGTNKVLRGGSWDSEPDKLRAASRLSDLATSSYNDYGFRIVRTIP